MVQSSVVPEPIEDRLTLDLSALTVTDDEFYQLCRDNPELRIEMTAQGELVVMPPTGSETGRRNSTLTQQLANWRDVDGTGVCFDSSTLFVLPNGARRSPDACWIRRERWQALTREQREKFAPICPDFVVELRSQTDRFSDLEKKMIEYIENGARLGWLLDPIQKLAVIYRPDQEPQRLEAPDTLRAEPELPGFVLNLLDILE
jgi:Uma2 family endonuclease